MTPSSELALTSLVVVALAAAAAIISIAAALGQKTRYGTTAPVSAGLAVKAGMLDKVEPEALDLDLYPPCLNVGDSGISSGPGERAFNPDGTMPQDSAGRAFARGSLASAKGGRATEGSLVLPKPAADVSSRPKTGWGLGVSDPGCSLGLGSHR